MDPKGKKIFKIATACVAVAVLVVAIIIMVRGAGLSKDLDFGAGAYYYADIPGFESVVRDDAYRTEVPVWVHVVLFLGWGWLMYRLWVWIDGRKS